MGSEILRPISNIPLTTTSSPGILRGAKGCRFEPGLWLRPNELYLMIMSKDREIPLPPAGFYEAPDKGETYYIAHFKPYQRSEYRTITEEDRIALHNNPEQLQELHKWRLFVFLAYEGDVPFNYVPTRNFDYGRARVENILANVEKGGRS